MITISDIDRNLMQKLESLARREHSTIEEIVLRYLHESVDLPETALHNKDKNEIIDNLSGLWTKEEAREFEESTSWLRHIDPELWQ